MSEHDPNTATIERDLRRDRGRACATARRRTTTRARVSSRSSRSRCARTRPSPIRSSLASCARGSRRASRPRRDRSRAAAARRCASASGRRAAAAGAARRCGMIAGVLGAARARRVAGGLTGDGRWTAAAASGAAAAAVQLRRRAAAPSAPGGRRERSVRRRPRRHDRPRAASASGFAPGQSNRKIERSIGLELEAPVDELERVARSDHERDEPPRRLRAQLLALDGRRGRRAGLRAAHPLEPPASRRCATCRGSRPCAHRASPVAT